MCLDRALTQKACYDKWNEASKIPEKPKGKAHKWESLFLKIGGPSLHFSFPASLSLSLSRSPRIKKKQNGRTKRRGNETPNHAARDSPDAARAAPAGGRDSPRAQRAVEGLVVGLQLQRGPGQAADGAAGVASIGSTSMNVSTRFAFAEGVEWMAQSAPKLGDSLAPKCA